jgi:DNA repair exonuclease SbcCD nuclease subunit
MIKKIAHSADWHLKKDVSLLDQFRFTKNEYIKSVKQQFEGLSYYDALQVVVGDVYHNYNHSNHVIDKELSQFFIDLLKISPVVFVLGNHDFNTQNLAEMPLLEKIVDPIIQVNKMYEKNNLHFFKESKCYELDNILFANYSHLHKSERPMDLDNHFNRDILKVGLYHDPIQNAKSYGYVFGEYSKSVEIFDGLDIVMAGDIHQYQTIQLKGGGPFVYCGSPYQQHFGETVSKHGYVIWDINDLNHYTHTFIELPMNPFNYIKVTSESLKTLLNDNYKILNK